jgi:CelD/BcsL family acetyltransferase involved in cellulose biosynthesis
VCIHKVLREVTEPLRLVVLNQIPEDEDLRQRWNDLLMRIDQPQVFYTYEWSLAVQRAYRATLRPLVVLGHNESNTLVGVASLATNAAGHVTFLCSATGDYCDFLSPVTYKAEFVGAVLAELRRRNATDLTLTNLPADSDTLPALREASKQHSYLVFNRTAYICTQVLLSRLEREAGTNKPVLPGKKMVRRSLAAMGREQPVRLDHARTWESIAALLPSFADAHVARFQITGRVSNLAHPDRRAFLEELAKLISPKGWFVLTRMTSGERVIAWHCGFQFHDTWFWYQPTFDSELEKYSPGFCLLAKLIEEAAHGSEIKVVDLGLGSEEYKERFANQHRETLYVTLRSSALKHAREVLRYRAAEMIKGTPALELGARRVLVRVSRIINVFHGPLRENKKA